MNKYHIRFNTKHTGNEPVWRVFENGVEYAATDVRIMGDAFTECVDEQGETKWNIACTGRIVWHDKVAVIYARKEDSSTPRLTTIYLDMDGVLADFDGRAEQVLRATKLERLAAEQQGRWPPAEWACLTQEKNFYRHLAKTDIADSLVAVARRLRDEFDLDIYMLTAIPRMNDMPDAIQDKVLWAQEHYPDIPVRFGPYSRDKYRHCRGAQDLLIDDRLDNIQDWQAQGGVTILVQAQDRQQAVRALEQMRWRAAPSGAQHTDPKQNF